MQLLAIHALSVCIFGWTNPLMSLNGQTKSESLSIQARCPTEGNPVSVEYCSYDGRCPAGQKCCSTTCNHSCSVNHIREIM